MKIRGNADKVDINNIERTMQISLTANCNKLAKDLQYLTAQVRVFIFNKLRIFF